MSEEIGMSENHKMIATALSSCRYAPATSGKRFAQSLAFMVKENKPLSEKQERYMYQLACQKRNQIGQECFNLIPRDIWVEYRKQHRSIK